MEPKTSISRATSTYPEWKKQWSIPGTTFTLSGYSRAKFRTCFLLKEIGLFLDAGNGSFNQGRNILITHSHGDHSFFLPMILIDCKDPHVYISEPAKDLCDSFVRQFYRLNSENPESAVDFYKMHGVNGGDTFEVTGNKTVPKIHVKVFACDHSVSCVGYGLSYSKEKLKEEYKGLPGKEIGKLKKEGKTITESVTDNFLIYLGDSTHAVFANPQVFAYRIIVCECTFLKEDDIELADQHKHTAWPNLIPIIKAHPDNTFVLVHFSLRYSEEEINQFFIEEMQREGVSNIKPWLMMLKD
mmetsp:Transcript_8730/g.9453  ORF Transcript_8730/g.9453 Transcript_8730/m.9453 type:complete len:299 (-) Transcript_8730:13-909(-)